MSETPVSIQYAELHCISNFTFLRGASHPEELVKTAARLGYRALAITDECSVAGVVRAHVAAKEHNMQLIIGSEFRLTDGLHLVVLATNRKGYGQLCRVITKGRMAEEKGTYRLTRKDFINGLPDCLVLWVPGVDQKFNALHGEWVKHTFGSRAWITVENLYLPQFKEAYLRTLSKQFDLPLVACGDVHMHARGRRALQDTLAAIRLNTAVADAGFALYPNGERHLRPLSRLQKLYSTELLAETVTIAGRCRFSLDELRYEYPEEIVPPDLTPTSYLRKLTEKGMRWRWPDGDIPDDSRKQIEHELALIAELKYEPFFLTVYDVVQYARSRNILCQGRGSAANSLVCYCLGITEIGPDRTSLLFERFVSRERNEPPDIDVDFEHERREEVIQYIYRKYSRERAALAATVITYRVRSAVRDVGKALGLNLDQIEKLAKAMQWWDDKEAMWQRLQEIGFDAESPVIQRLFVLVNTIIGFPRHLSQHVGGFVISRGPLAELVPVENAAMPDRTVIQWDKDDLESLGLLKVDVLGLGMLTAIRRCFDLIKDFRGNCWTLDKIPEGDEEVYAMIQHADTIGVFQIESRAQMSMLPRLRPQNYYDLVIEVAIVRPGPIQGDMVHPYLARRDGKEPVTFPKDDLIPVLGRTFGVPIFQEQAMQIAIVAAGFTPGEADQLRRAMAAWKRRGGFEPFRQRLIDGMLARGYKQEFAERIYEQIKGFGDYGFPESHAASFALLAYVSSWLKYHEPAAFTCALLNSQPMGFYAPAQLIQDVRRHNVEVRPVDVQSSLWDCTLERREDDEAALRLGLRLLKGLSITGAERLINARRGGRFINIEDLARRAALNKADMAALAAGDALRQLSNHRHRARWDVAGVETGTPLFQYMNFQEGLPLLRRPTEGEDILADYDSMKLSVRRHPLALLRNRLNKLHIKTAEELWKLPNGARVRTAGVVTARQRPGTAKGVIFMTLEDETGSTNVVIWQKIITKQRRIVVGGKLVGIAGRIQNHRGVLHLVAEHLEDHSHLLGNLYHQSRDFH
ncbi:MAG: error-prone DNA polymerase [Gammaproteobacteria bacterium]|nr:error-prone DNA polymerase [Gammaproteobacteria bacterium]